LKTALRHQEIIVKCIPILFVFSFANDLQLLHFTQNMSNILVLINGYMW